MTISASLIDQYVYSQPEKKKKKKKKNILSLLIFEQNSHRFCVRIPEMHSHSGSNMAYSPNIKHRYRYFNFRPILGQTTPIVKGCIIHLT